MEGLEIDQNKTNAVEKTYYPTMNEKIEGVSQPPSFVILLPLIC
jgi:hypothetical protein